MATIAPTAAPIANPGAFFIDGEWQAPSSDSVIQVVTPSTEQVFVTVAEAQAPDVDRAVAAARQAFDTGPWPRLSHAERAVYLRKIGDELATRAADLGRIWTSEMGVLSLFGDMLMPAVAATYHNYANMAETYPWVERHKPEMGEVGLLVREPVGVVAAIIPWNFPAMLITHKVAPALLAGCTVVVKASPEAPGHALILAEVAEKVGLPKGVINVLTADREVSELLVRDPRIDKVAFTGSSLAGKKIASICGERIARCTLELGGKSAAVILDDYDLDTAAQAISATARIMTGQVCSSLTRIIVPKRRHDALADALGSSFASIKVGDPFEAGIDMGPLAMSRQLDRVNGFIETGKAEGARLVTGGSQPAHLNRGYYVEPTVFANVDNDMTIAREEIFGPVLSVIPAEDEEHAVAIANDTVFGLNASVFTNDADRAYHVARQLRSGTVGQNMFRSDLTIAFGGFKQSGIGREGGTEGLRAYLEAKTIILDAEPSKL